MRSLAHCEYSIEVVDHDAMIYAPIYWSERRQSFNFLEPSWLTWDRVLPISIRRHCIYLFLLPISIRIHGIVIELDLWSSFLHHAELDGPWLQLRLLDSFYMTQKAQRAEGAPCQSCLILQVKCCRIVCIGLDSGDRVHQLFLLHVLFGGFLVSLVSLEVNLFNQGLL